MLIYVACTLNGLSVPDADNEENDREVWETLINAVAYDFPNVRQLKADIRTILDSDMEDAQIVRNDSREFL